MKKEKVLIENIPAIIWGGNKENIILAVHGNKSSKDDKIIAILAEEGIKLGYQTVSFDLPNHGERTDKENTVKVENYLRDLRKVFEYIKSKNKIKITLLGNSMGAYFSLLELKEERLDQVLFLSPVVNMFEIIKGMMYWFNISEEELCERKKIETPIGETLYYDYYKYVKDNEVNLLVNLLEDYVLSNKKYFDNVIVLKNNFLKNKENDNFELNKLKMRNPISIKLMIAVYENRGLEEKLLEKYISRTIEKYDSILDYIFYLKKYI